MATRRCIFRRTFNFLQTTQGRVSHVQTVLFLLRNADVTLKLGKCEFFTNIIGYFKHFICLRPLEIVSHIIDAISRLIKPTNIAYFYTFLELCNVLAWFVLSFARLSAPLNAMLQDKQPEAFGLVNENDLKFMSLLMIVLVSPFGLTLPDTTGSMTLDADACNV